MVYFLVALLVFVLGIELEYRYGLRQTLLGRLKHAGAVLGYLALFLLYLAGEVMEGLAKHLDTLRKKLIVLAVVLFYVLLAIGGIMLLVATGMLATATGYGVAMLVFAILLALLVAFLLADFSGKMAAGVASLAILVALLWTVLASFFGSIGGAVSALWNSAGNFFAGLTKGAVAILAGVSVGIPSCSPKAEAPVVTAIQPRVVVGQTITPAMMVTKTIIAQHGEGCLRISERGGLPLTLAECKTLSMDAGREVIVKRKRTIAPMVALDEVWYLVQEGQRIWWIIHQK